MNPFKSENGWVFAAALVVVALLVWAAVIGLFVGAMVAALLVREHPLGWDQLP